MIKKNLTLFENRFGNDKVYRQSLSLKFTNKRIVSPIAPMAGKNLFIFSLKMKSSGIQRELPLKIIYCRFASKKKPHHNGHGSF